MHIDLTNEQYNTLAKMACLAATMADEVITENDDPKVRELKKDIANLEEYIYSFHKEFNAKEMYETKSGDPDHTPEAHEIIGDIVNEHSDFVFWETLSEELVTRDLEDKYGEKLSKMKPEDFEDDEDMLMEKYAEEFEENGVDNLRVVKE